MLDISRLRPCLPVVFAGLVLDLYSKRLATSYGAEGTSQAWLAGLVHLHLVRNSEGFLGLPASIAAPYAEKLLTTGVLILLMLLLLLLTWRTFVPSVYWGISLVIGGGAANLCDRLLHDGAVTDFLRLTLGPVNSGVFNLADILILAGSFLIGMSIAQNS